METSTYLELFGYLGSLIVIVSMLMTSVVKLRVINTIGSLLFSTYALLIHSYPTMVMNLFLAGINIWHLLRLRNKEKHFDLIPVSPGNGVLQYILNTFRGDIARYFPGFDPEKIDGCEGYLILCQSAPAGVFLARKTGEDAGLEVVLDYSTPTYRDCSVGKFLYGNLAGMGYGKLISEGPSEAHRKYLRKMGFQSEQDGRYCLTL